MLVLMSDRNKIQRDKYLVEASKSIEKSQLKIKDYFVANAKYFRTVILYLTDMRYHFCSLKQPE